MALAVGTGAVLSGGCAAEEREDARAFVGVVAEVDDDRGELALEIESGADFLADRRVRAAARTGDLANAAVGDRIRAILADAENGGYELQQVWPAEEDARRIVEGINRRLREEAVIHRSNNYRGEGDGLPRFALYDQFGEVVRTERFEGKRIVINFIFTRCMDPNMCPAATERMRQLQNAAKEAGVENFELVSVTLDPAYDTPGVLREYATRRGIDLDNFSFLTGPESAVRDLITQIGIITEPDDDMYLTHTMATILVDENGVILHRMDGSQWMIGDFLNRLKETAS